MVEVAYFQEQVVETVCSQEQMEQVVEAVCFQEQAVAAARFRARAVVVAVPVQVQVGGVLAEGQPEVEEPEVAASVGLAFEAQWAFEEPARVGQAVAVLVNPAAAAGAVVEAAKKVVALAVEYGVAILQEKNMSRMSH